MYEVVEVTGIPGGECYLIMSGRSAVLLDSGYGFAAERTAENIRAVLGRRTLDYILLTHSHYDHAFGSAGIAQSFPTAKIVCGDYAAKIFIRSGALALMRSLDNKAASDEGFAPYGGPPPHADIILQDGQELVLPEMTIRAVATPGHTNCSMSYYFPEDGLLATSETTGTALEPPRVTAAFIIGYQITLDSIERLKALRPSRLILPHTGVLLGEDAATFFDRSRTAAAETAAFILDRYDQGDSVDEIVQAYHEAYFRGRIKSTQPERAFLLNAEAMIPRLLREMGRDIPEQPARQNG